MCMAENFTDAPWRQGALGNQQKGIEMIAVTRSCSKCGNEKTLTDFYRAGLQCRKCVSSVKAVYRAANSEKISASKAKWRSANKEKVSASGKSYRAKNAESIAFKNKAYAKANPEKISAMGARYRANNPERVARKAAMNAGMAPDWLVAYRLTMYSKILKPKDVPVALIETRRSVILLKRLIRGTNNEKR